MEDNSKRNRPSLPLSALRLLVSPIQLVSAAVWQNIQQNVVANYGMLEEFVSIVTDIVPELLTSHQRAQLILGLRARFILDLCRFKASSDPEVVRPHLERMQTLIEAWVMEADATNVTNSDFVDFVKNMLNDPEKRENFFQSVFPEAFGPTFDEDLHTLMSLLLSRLEKFLPLQTFQQVASMFDEVSSVLEDCMESVSQCEDLRIVLQYQKGFRRLDHNDGSLDGASILSALKLPSVKRCETDSKQAQENILDCASSDMKTERVSSPRTTQTHTDTITEHHTSQTNSDRTNWTPGKNDDLQSRAEDESRHLKQYCVQLEKVVTTPALQRRPVRQNRGLKMKQILLKEKRGLAEGKPASRKVTPSKRARQEVPDNEDLSILNKDSYMAPVSNCSDDSWSYYSDEGSCHSTSSSRHSLADSWSNYSDDSSSLVSPVSSPSDCDSLSGCSNEDPPSINPKTSASSRKTGISEIKAKTHTQKIHQAYCFICKEHLHTRLTSHMRTHFPGGDYACPRCDTRFKLLSSFKTHMHRTCFEYGKEQVDPEKPGEATHLLKCDKCEEAFRYKISLDRHKITHDELYCVVCRRVLRDKAMLARHKASHTVFHCTRCKETFTVFMPLLRHCENIHKISRPFQCNHCPKTFPKLRLLIIHEWKHTGELPFRCTHCNCRFKCDADLTYHERVHTKEKPYLCPECGKTFSQNSNMLRHMNFIHGKFQKVKRHSCSECEKSFKEKGALKKHQRSKHYNELFRHPCPYCGKLVSESSLARHKLIHTGQKPFKCTEPECDKWFRTTSEVKSHVLRHHTTERPYKCDVCGKGFVKMCFLTAHVKIHSKEKPFVCPICEKSFLKRHSMLRHKKLVHSHL